MGLKPLEQGAVEQFKTNAPDKQFSGIQQLPSLNVQHSHAVLCCSARTCKMNVQKAKARNNNEAGLDTEKKKIITGCLQSFILQARSKCWKEVLKQL